MAETKKTSLTQEFKTFISRGNVIDLAVGIIIGSAFTSIVNSLVKDIIMPPIGLLMGKVNFSDLKLVIQNQPEVAVTYGNLIQNTINFLVVAIAVFSLVKGINSLQKKEEKTAEKKKETELSVLKDIKKLLKNNK
ncbi:large-conductance mechanosensitive channel protein MscL [bacterium]|nr:large-conductance mechanosensitive channel protein MscL [bacterium]